MQSDYMFINIGDYLLCFLNQKYLKIAHFSIYYLLYDALKILQIYYAIQVSIM